MTTGLAWIGGRIIRTWADFASIEERSSSNVASLDTAVKCMAFELYMILKPQNVLYFSFP